MLQTLLRIGEWKSKGKSEWDRFLERPKVARADKRGNENTNFHLAIVFDLDDMEVLIDSHNLNEYDESCLAPLKALKIQGGNNKAIYPTVPPAKIAQLYKTFFGKENESTKEGELAEAIRKYSPSMLTERFQDLLARIFSLKDTFLGCATVIEQGIHRRTVNFQALENKLSLAPNESVVLTYAAVKSSEFGFDSPCPIAEIPEYVEFLRRKFFGLDGAEKEPGVPRLCYASGIISGDVEELDLTDRYSLNKMFVTETRNYASRFDKQNFGMNYQVSRINQEKLDFASTYLLKEGSYKVRIANVDHVIIPQFMDNDKIDLELALTGIKTKSDLLFSLEALENSANHLSDETDHIFWINFVAFESDGNYFKSIEVIKDVSSFHFRNVIEAFRKVNWSFKQLEFSNWSNAMSNYGNSGLFFNLNSVYSLIPVRKDQKKNKALDLFKAILENRKVDFSVLFSYFSELVRCHYFNRYESYTNIQKSSKDYFKMTVQECVFRYLSFIEVLKNLKCINMEDSQIATEEVANKFDRAINDFFDRMKLNQEQKAMFYLGRMLNTVEFIQKDKKKTVIEKVNFNGMDRDDIRRLRISLLEKAKQYQKINRTIGSDSRFGQLFDFNNWNLNPDEALFFLLTGYSFGVTGANAQEIQNTENE